MAGKEVRGIYCCKAKFGRLTVHAASTERGAIRTVIELDRSSQSAAVFRGIFPDAEIVEDYGPNEHLMEAVEAALSNRQAEGALAMDLRFTPFQRSVLGAIGTIPFGQTKTYGQVASMVGRPGGARAVGQVMGKNPLPLIYP